MEIAYSIAGLQIEIVGKQTLKLLDLLPEFEIFQANTFNKESTDIRICMDEEINTDYLTDIKPIHSFTVSDNKHSFLHCKEGYLYEIRKLDSSKIVNIFYNPEVNTVLMSSCDCTISLKYAIWLAFLLPSIDKKVLPIHASAIVKDSECVLFLGESGTGKSTHTRLWMENINESHLLNDDSPLLRIQDDCVIVYGSPWSGKTDCYRQRSAPLKAIVRLKQHPENKIIRHNLLGSIGAIHPSFPPFLVYDCCFSEKILCIIDRIVRNTPVYELKCLPNKEAAEIAYTSVY